MSGERPRRRFPWRRRPASLAPEPAPPLTDAAMGVIGETVIRAFHDGYARGKSAARDFPNVEIYRWVCPVCKGIPDGDGISGCRHCHGAALTNDVEGWPADELTPAPRPPALMPSPCGDCAYRRGSPESECGTVKLPGTEENRGPFFCHVGLPKGRSGYTSTAWVGELPLGAWLCAGWYAKVTGEQAPTRPYRERLDDHDRAMAASHRCTEDCVCPACGSPMFYAPPTTSRLGEHACKDPACLFAGGEHDAMKRWMPAERRRSPAELPEWAPPRPTDRRRSPADLPE